MKRLFQIITLSLFVVIVVSAFDIQDERASEERIYQHDCRFGVGAASGINGYDLEPLQIGAYIDWQYDAAIPNATQSGISYVRMLRVGDYDNRYENAVNNLENIVALNPGAYFVIGNEPDTIYENQDGVPPEIYAERFFVLASNIRALDPTAKIGFGSIVQPTPIRLLYLDLAWNRLIELAGSQSNASALIDYWTIHNFILNEAPDEWGVGIPPGLDNFRHEAIQISEIKDTHSIDIFAERVSAFREWMVEKGERNKPLWISEYGSLLPPVDPLVGPDYLNVSDQETSRFMVESVEYMLTEKDPMIGLPSDQYRLVQRWFWYSLNDFRYKFGGSLYDPLDKQRTLVGDSLVKYQGNRDLGPDLWIMSATIHADQFIQDVPKTYRIDILLANSGSLRSNNAVVKVFQGEPTGRPIASKRIEALQGCGEDTKIASIYLYNFLPVGSGWFSIHVDLDGDIQSANNYLWFKIPHERFPR